MTPARTDSNKFIPVVNARLGRLLGIVILLFSLLVVDSVYLAAISLLEQLSGEVHQNYFYLLMFLLHLALGLLITLPVIVFALATCGVPGAGPTAMPSGQAWDCFSRHWSC